MKFNVNHNVRVKLTDLGRKLHRQNHDELFAWLMKHSGASAKPELYPYRAPEEDADGWSTWQLWCLMAEFGKHCRNGMDIPFETEIELLGDPLASTQEKDE